MTDILPAAKALLQTRPQLELITFSGDAYRGSVYEGIGKQYAQVARELDGIVKRLVVWAECRTTPEPQEPDKDADQWAWSHYTKVRSRRNVERVRSLDDLLTNARKDIDECKLKVEQLKYVANDVGDVARARLDSRSSGVSRSFQELDSLIQQIEDHALSFPQQLEMMRARPVLDAGLSDLPATDSGHDAPQR